MLFSIENTFAAFKDEVWTDGIFCSVQCLVERLLFWNQDDRAVVFWLAMHGLACQVDCALNIIPDVRRVVPVQIDNRFWFWMWWRRIGCVCRLRKVARDSFKIILVCHGSNDVNHFVEGNVGVLCLVWAREVPNNAVIWNPLKLNYWHLTQHWDQTLVK